MILFCHHDESLVKFIGIMVSRNRDMEVRMTQDNQDHDDKERGKGHGGPEVSVIKIDRKEYKVREPVVTGTQLRRLPEPDIGSDRDLFEVVPGGSDRKIANDQEVKMMGCASSPRRRRLIPASVTKGEEDATEARNGISAGTFTACIGDIRSGHGLHAYSEVPAALGI